MSERDYWVHLEYRVCHELDGLRHRAARPYWCDGFEPSRYVLDGRSPRILGRAWMGIGPRHQEPWDFMLLLDRPVNAPEGIEWSALLPHPDATRWLTVDAERKHLIIEPSAAVPAASP